VQVPLENLVGEEGKGWDCAKYLLASERTNIANIGFCRERLDYARHLASQTMQAGRPVIEDLALCAEIAVLDAEIRALEITNWRFLLSLDTATVNPAFASVLKLKGVELQQQLAALLAGISGPAGLEHRKFEQDPDSSSIGPLMPRYFYSRAASIYGGTSEIQKDIIAKTVLG
jgi:pimeloyl-CoA dehydrogenase